MDRGLIKSPSSSNGQGTRTAHDGVSPTTTRRHATSHRHPQHCRGTRVRRTVPPCAFPPPLPAGCRRSKPASPAAKTALPRALSPWVDVARGRAGMEPQASSSPSPTGEKRGGRGHRRVPARATGRVTVGHKGPTSVGACQRVPPKQDPRSTELRRRTTSGQGTEGTAEAYPSPLRTTLHRGCTLPPM